jgi:hypothetical protein
MGIDSHLSTCVGTQSPKYLEMAQGHISLSHLHHLHHSLTPHTWSLGPSTCALYSMGHCHGAIGGAYCCPHKHLDHGLRPSQTIDMEARIPHAGQLAIWLKTRALRFTHSYSADVGSNYYYEGVIIERWRRLGWTRTTYNSRG